MTLLRLFLLLLIAGSASAADGPKMSLQALAESHELVAIVHLRDTRYEYVRDFPSRGWAELTVLIPYKGPLRQRDRLRVHAEGLDPTACYFPDDPDFDGRFLVFLNPRAEGGWEGQRPWCQLPVLVTADNRYALLHPAEGLADSELAALAENLEFSDPAAWIDPRALTQTELEALRSRFVMRETEDGRLRHTQGVPISAVRALMFPNAGD